MHENDFSIPSNLSSALSFKGPTGVCTPAMEPDFLLLLTDLPGPAADWVRSLGAETCSDIRHLWPSAATLVGEWLEGPGAGCSAEAGVQLAHFYNAAARSSELACKRLAQNVVADRQSRFCSEASKRSLVLPAAQPKSKARMLFLNREGHTDVPALTYAPATSKPAVAEGEVRGLKLRALFILCCQLFLRPEDLGVATLDFCDTEAIDSLAGMALVATQRLSIRRISTLAAALRRWQAFCTEVQADARSCEPRLLADFLRQVSAGGPTAAASLFQCLKWFVENLGAPFPVGHFMVKPYRFHANGHTASQAKELQPWELVNMLRFCESLTGTPRVLGMFFVQAAVSCIRFQHMQRSRLTQDHGSWLEFKCAQGKTRRKGVRPAYSWAMPPVSFGTLDVVSELRRFLQDELLPEVTFLWPGIQLSRSDFWHVREDTVFRLDRKLSGSRFLEAFRGFCCSVVCRPRRPPVLSIIASAGSCPREARFWVCHPRMLRLWAHGWRFLSRTSASLDGRIL